MSLISDQAPTEVHLDYIAQIAISVSDLARSKAFYQDTLGMSFLFEAGTMVFFQCGTVRLMIGIAEAPVSCTGTILYFKVEDIHATYTNLAERDVIFLQAPHRVARMPDHELWMAFLKDPDGHTLGLMSEVPHPV